MHDSSILCSATLTPAYSKTNQSTHFQLFAGHMLKQIQACQTSLRVAQITFPTGELKTLSHSGTHLQVEEEVERKGCISFQVWKRLLLFGRAWGMTTEWSLQSGMPSISLFNQIKEEEVSEGDSTQCLNEFLGHKQNTKAEMKLRCI